LGKPHGLKTPSALCAKPVCALPDGRATARLAFVVRSRSGRMCGKHDYIPNRLLIGEQHYQPVNADAMPAAGGIP